VEFKGDKVPAGRYLYQCRGTASGNARHDSLQSSFIRPGATSLPRFLANETLQSISEDNKLKSI
jgi:hypothetical protein